ncbi:hypothetical protein BH23BAC4_BH23BAC4_17600 [soil metagenome]
MRLYFILALWLVGFATAYSQTPEIEMATAVFAYDDEAAVVEVQLAFAAHSLRFEQEEGRFRSVVSVQLRAESEDGARVYFNDRINYTFVTADPSALVPGQQFVQQARLVMPTGEVTLELTALPEGTPIRTTVRVPDFSVRPALSDVLLASRIEQAEDPRAPFTRRGLTIIPRPDALFGQRLDRVYYFVELYGEAGNEGDRELTIQLLPGDRSTPVAGLERIEQRPVAPLDAVAGSFDIIDVPSGAYRVRVELRGDGEGVVATSERRLHIFNPGVSAAAGDPAAADFASGLSWYDDEDVLLELDLVRIMVPERERVRINRIAGMDVPGAPARAYLEEYWRDRLQERVPFLERAALVHQRYGSAHAPGHRTDRGRVLIRHGTPTRVDAQSAVQAGSPSEIWHYEALPGIGAAIFVFVDTRGTGIYRLVHGTAPGEPHHPDWERRLGR